MTTTLTDHLPLIRRVDQLIQSHDFKIVSYDAGREAERLGFISLGVKRPVIVTAAETALEVGSPQHLTSSNLLWTREACFDADTVSCHGPSSLLPGPISLGLLVMLQLDAVTDPTGPNFFAIKNLSNRLPGYMARSLPGKLWLRLSYDLMKSGFTLESLGQILIRAYREAIPAIINMRVVLVAEQPDLIDQLIEIEQVSSMIARDNQRLHLEADGSLSCVDLDCEVCDEKPACDTIRDVIRRSRRNA